ncbi:hypothetical protein pEaSNUABM56_00148 [Erwinia phage pEa_SNUABM_56]|uniref:Uncharacterized protein n=1 Tax=Erwinia phage pEp_SNUABM_01 TaxID=2601643 RepID=A0A5J6DAM0_9CAUD|nr:hypothetical protein HWC63_gp246 [Erwinia phage pEp_SNUABM_01]QEQ94932.1 hypothetical protein pEpSNUABM01_106 [Erwinia phage pEp_SNUABM_01]UYL84860.1 hypothetical protein pEaSNUABM55_00078 [Erwinia phage pEa_SNUABM_55]UYL85177.1 hypothetical protein pEaSNUABM56_00148 [Erwinia phage pEa_SNUABM_56]
MITTPDSPIFGKADKPQIYVPNMRFFGSFKQDTPPSILPIDLTSQALDSRVTYTGPVHAYLQQAGTLTVSAANVWPLEYRNGAVVGRSLPEPAATNLITDTEFANVSNASANTPWVTNIGAVADVVNGFNGRPARRTNSDWTRFGVYQAGGTAKWLRTDTVAPTQQDFGTYDRFYYDATPDAAGIVRYYTSRRDTANYIYYQAQSVANTKYLYSVFRADDTTAGIIQSLPQIEAGSLVTSPINSTSNGQTRAESNVAIDTQGASGLTLTFSDGTTRSYTNVSNPFMLPKADYHWGTKYLTKIEFSL